MMFRSTLYLTVITLVASLLVLLGGTTSSYAQSGSTTGMVIGTVKDEQGASLVNANVTVRQIETNLIRTTQVGEDGAYRFIQLVPGNYEIKVELQGFQPKTENIVVTIGTTILANFNLNVGDVAGDVVVITANSSIDNSKTESSTNIDGQSIDNLPINRRDFTQFTLTSPRATVDRTPKQGVTDTSGISFNGQSARINNITIDGLDNNDPFAGTVRSTFGQDAVQEFQVVSDSYSAEFGRALGGIINIVTKGGGNDLHGRIFFFNRNDSINTRDVFAPFKPPYKQYQFGGSLSGPIKHDKLFYFTSFERLSVKQNNFVTISNSTIAATNRVGFDLRNGPIPFALDSTQFLGRFDAKLAPNDTFFVRYNRSGTYNGQLEPFGGLIAETNGGAQRLKDQTFAVTNTYLNNHLNLVNETRFLYSRRDQFVDPLGEGPQVALFAPEGRITFGRGTFLPQTRQERIYHIVNTSTLSRGVQQIKFGIDYLYNLFPSATNVPIFPGGLTFFTPLDFAALLGNPAFPAFTALEAFDPSLRSPVQRQFLTALAPQLPVAAPGFPANVPLADLSLPQVYAQGFGDTRLRLPQRSFSAFIQDDIKVRPNLLVKLGVRYDINRIDQQPRNNGNFSPRIAFSYNPAFLPRVNVHASYGIFFSGLQVTGASTAVQTLGTGVAKIPVLPFPFSVLAFAQPGHHFPAGDNLPPGVQLIPQLSQTYTYAPDLRNSYTQQATFGFDYQINKTTAVSINYDYVRGNKLFSNRNINPVVRPIPGDALNSQIFGRVDPTQGNIFEFESSFDSYYNGLTVSILRRFSNHVGLNAHYTFSKAIDDFTDFRTDLQEIINPLRISDERALSLQDARSRFVLSGIWDLNYTKNKFLTGFQISTIISLNSGQPFNLLTGVDQDLNADNPPGDRPLIGGVPIGRNLGIMPGYANTDIRLSRLVKIGETVEVQGFMEVFNLFNRTNISDLNRIYPPDAFGNVMLPPKDGNRFTATRDRFISAFPSRVIQFGFRLSF